MEAWEEITHGEINFNNYQESNKMHQDYVNNKLYISEPFTVYKLNPLWKLTSDNDSSREAARVQVQLTPAILTQISGKIRSADRWRRRLKAR